MASESPMMHRMRREGGSSRIGIPKRGRIRFTLIALALVVGFRFAGAIFTKDSARPAPETAVAAAKPRVRREKAPRAPKVAHKKTRFKKPKAVLASFGAEQVSALLKENNCSFRSPTDTIKSGKQTLVFHYALDTAIQNFSNRLMERYRPLYGAAIIMAPNSGRVLGMVSYRNDSVPDLGNNLYCKSFFPAASVYKTITAAAAIELARLDSQSPLHHVGRNHTLYRFQLERELRQFKEIPFEEAFAMSINPVFARIGMYMLSRNALTDYSLKFGFNTAIPFELDNEVSRMREPDSLFTVAELASGFNQETTISPLFGAMVAGAIAERGRMPQPCLVDSVTTVPGDSCVFRATPVTWRTPINETTARELRVMMSRVARNGTARKSFRYLRQSTRFDSLQYGGKTGSVDKDSIGRVDWFVGFIRHPTDARQRLAVGIVTVHGAYWTVHSSFLAAEVFRVYLRNIQLEDERREKEKALAERTVAPQSKG